MKDFWEIIFMLLLFLVIGAVVIWAFFKLLYKIIYTARKAWLKAAEDVKNDKR